MVHISSELYNHFPTDSYFYNSQATQAIQGEYPLILPICSPPHLTACFSKRFPNLLGNKKDYNTKGETHRLHLEYNILLFGSQLISTLIMLFSGVNHKWNITNIYQNYINLVMYFQLRIYSAELKIRIHKEMYLTLRIIGSSKMNLICCIDLL